MSGIEVGERPEKLGIREVAALAGVSHMTVSRVLNGHPGIRPSTRQRVLDVVRELDFKPNSAARALATQRTQRIGVIVDSAVEFGPTSTLRGLELAARSSGYSVTSVAMQDDANLTPEAAVGHLIAEGVDALCVVAPRSSSVTALRSISIDVPVLVVKAAKDPTFLTVSVDQQLGTMLAVDHLVSLGHRDILHLAGPLDWLDARGRERAFHTRIEEWGLKARPIVVGDWTADFGYEYAAGLKGVPDYTAMFVANDEMALGVVHGFHDRGIRVPDDVSVVGFDDLPFSRHFIPPLTTVRQDFHALGTKAMEVLRAALEGREIPQRSKIASELVVRSSTAPPRST
ncbi:LacI family DNA-binding transcriptional regulator [Agromyces sp. H3Y2-19a]|uniref:LacI family DNA-binding transcriptional regulator n=1 Tax=Agromyces TaxID=33877 RepID=UPI001E2AAC5D|nr:MULTISPECIES: LacI family DNA-binding transcriptional regulator [Agromyces]MCD5345158.1 LacI family DNA-binding transcriptional regulator [Agromyces sp. S2-1-8]MDF0513682.1 LacI family DNA-binding transcriptional regulator [Agromyces chromiiresistens]